MTTSADPGAFWKEFIRETSPEFRKPTVEQLETFIAPTYQALIDGVKYCEPHLREIVARQQPDVIVEDNVVIFPALTTSGAPFVRIVSCNPLEVKGADIAPTFSGLAADDDSEWESFRTEYERTHRSMWTDFNDFVVSCGADPLPDLDFMPVSQHANLYVFPQGGRLRRSSTAQRYLAPARLVSAFNRRTLRAPSLSG